MTTKSRIVAAGSGHPTVVCGARTRAGGECKKAPVPGNKRCKLHGAGTPRGQEKRAHALLRRTLADLVTPIAESDPEADPVVGFMTEYRRTVAAIRYWEAELANLTGNDALVWGKIKESYTDATEYPGSTVEYGTAFNQAYLGWRLEREHLEKLLKTWIGAKMDERRAQITGQHLDMMQNMLESFARALGFDPHNPDVRRKAVAAITST